MVERTLVIEIQKTTVPIQSNVRILEGAPREQIKNAAMAGSDDGTLEHFNEWGERKQIKTLAPPTLPHTCLLVFLHSCFH